MAAFLCPAAMTASVPLLGAQRRRCPPSLQLFQAFRPIRQSHMSAFYASCFNHAKIRPPKIAQNQRTALNEGYGYPLRAILPHSRVFTRMRPYRRCLESLHYRATSVSVVIQARTRIRSLKMVVIALSLCGAMFCPSPTPQRL
jgi:hypothetical protein